MATAWSVAASSAGGPYAASTTTTLATLTSNGTYVFQIDLTNMVGGDQLRIHILGCCSSSTSPVQIWGGSWANVQLNPGKVSPMLPSDKCLTVTFENVLASTSTAFPWQILTV